MKRSIKITLAAAVALAAVGAGTVYAQMPPRGMMGPMNPARMCDRGPAMLSGWLAYTETRLNLTAEQRPAWTSFATDVRSAGEKLLGLCPELKQPRPAREDIAGQLAMHEHMLTAGLDAVKVARPALEKLNAALTPEQRTRFAELLPGRGGPRMQGRFGHGPDRHDGPGRGPNDDRRDGPPRRG